MFSVVKSVIKHQGSTSDPISSYMGVKQVDASSALLFTMFVNDITEHINTNLEGIFPLNEIINFSVRLVSVMRGHSVFHPRHNSQ